MERLNPDDLADFSSAYEHHYSELVGFALIITRDPRQAEDLAQDAFVQLLRHWDTLRDQSLVVAYLRKVVVNSARSAIRRSVVAKRRAPLLVNPIAADPSDAERMVVLQAIHSLPVRQRMCIALRFYGGLSMSEVAEVMGTSSGTVKSQIHKALRRLETILGENDD